MKNNKVVAILILALIVSVVFVGCGGGSPKIAGYWESLGIDAGDGTIQTEFLGFSYQGVNTLLLKKDGTAIQTVFGEVVEGVWEEKDGKVVISNLSASVVCSIDDEGRLYHTVNGMSLYYQRIGDDKPSE